MIHSRALHFAFLASATLLTVSMSVSAAEKYVIAKTAGYAAGCFQFCLSFLYFCGETQAYFWNVREK